MRLIVGGPGSGKTTRLLREVKKALRAGTPPERIAFVAFTNAAANEARGRAVETLGLSRKQLPWFRTIHSLAFRRLGLQPYETMGVKNWRELGELLGVQFGRELLPDGRATEGTLGARLRYISGYARAARLPLAEAYRHIGVGVSEAVLRRYTSALEAYKADTGLLDFDDMLDRYVEHGEPVPVDLAVIDEGQDLTPSQWRVVERAFRGAAEIVVGGDDDQAIYAWAGADVGRFLSLSAAPEVLPVSHRLPRKVFELAGRVSNRISKRYTKAWRPTRRVGSVRVIADPGAVEFTPGAWLVLARCRYLLRDIAERCREHGVTYSVAGAPAVDPMDVRAIRGYEALRAGRALDWADVEPVIAALAPASYAPPDGVDRPWTAAELGLDVTPIWHDALVGMSLRDREYYLACLRRGERIQDPARVRLETIHGAKGTEADHVCLLTDVSRRVEDAVWVDPDTEHRVFYVGATRARKSLTVVLPQTGRAYRGLDIAQ